MPPKSLLAGVTLLVFLTPQDFSEIWPGGHPCPGLEGSPDGKERASSKLMGATHGICPVPAVALRPSVEGVQSGLEEKLTGPEENIEANWQRTGAELRLVLEVLDRLFSQPAIENKTKSKGRRKKPPEIGILIELKSIQSSLQSLRSLFADPPTTNSEQMNELPQAAQGFIQSAWKDLNRLDDEFRGLFPEELLFLSSERPIYQRMLFYGDGSGWRKVQEKLAQHGLVSPLAAVGLEEPQDPSRVTLAKLVGTHPFPIRVFSGADREETYVPGPSGKIIYPKIQLLGETVKQSAGNRYASQLDREMVYYLTTATPQQIALQSSPQSRDILTWLKGLIDEAGVVSLDMVVEAAIRHLTGPYAADGTPSYVNLIGYVNRVLANEGNPRKRLILPSIDGPEEIASLNFWFVKEGDITVVFQAEVILRNGKSVLLAINVAKDRALAAASLARDYQAIALDYARDPNFIMQPYALGTGIATAWNGKVEVPVFVEEWLDEFHELHLYPEDQGRFSIWLDQRAERGTILSRVESGQIRESIARIRELYYGAGSRGIEFGRGLINGGDFVARKESDGSWQVMMVWHRANVLSAGLEEPGISQTMAVLDEAAPQGEGILVLEAGVLGRAGLEAFVARVGPDLRRRFVLFGKESAAAKEAAARNGITVVDSDDLGDLAFRLAGREERANRIGYVGNAQTAGLLARILPAGMAVTPFDPRTTLPDMLRFLGYPSSLLGGINASGLEEQFARSRAA